MIRITKQNYLEADTFLRKRIQDITSLDMPSAFASTRTSIIKPFTNEDRFLLTAKTLKLFDHYSDCTEIFESFTKFSPMRQALFSLASTQASHIREHGGLLTLKELNTKKFCSLYNQLDVTIEDEEEEFRKYEMCITK